MLFYFCYFLTVKCQLTFYCDFMLVFIFHAFWSSCYANKATDKTTTTTTTPF